jgi:predicted phage baseplate assembly protein
MKILKTSEICRDDTTRRQAIRATEGKQDGLNGIDYIEVSEDQRTLTVFFLLKAPEQELQPGNVRIDGGRRVRNIRVLDVTFCRNEDPERDDCMRVKVDKPGDFSTYTLCLVETDEYGRPTETPLDKFDLRYVCVDFSFKANCPSDLDCPVDTCPPGVLDEPEINYLAKDYASFRQLILDRLALIMPDWQERHVPDIGIALVEILAYAGDYLSYYQDAVATEAYLGTARQRISVRRHVRLVDYQMHEGSNARTWLLVESSDDVSLDPQDTYFITGYNDALAVSSTMLMKENLQGIPSSDYEVFEPLIVESILLQPRELKDPASLVIKLRDAKAAVSSYLRGQFTAGLQQLLGQYDPSNPPSDTLLGALITELNRLIQHGNLSDQQRFAQVTLSPETSQLIQGMLKGEGINLPLLNRLLLDDAYPQELANSQEIQLYEAHNKIPFYTWDEQECCLPRGATTATLRDEYVPVPSPGVETTQEQKQSGDAPSSARQSSTRKGKDKAQQEPPKDTPYSPEPEQPAESERKLHLQVGDVLIFEEVLGPKTGNPADADPTHRHAVRLTRVERASDKLHTPAVPVVEIEWGIEDALPFPLCLSDRGSPDLDCKLLENISIARGNVILVDYGQTEEEDLDPVHKEKTVARCECGGIVGDVEVIPGLFRPRLQQAPITFSEPLPTDAPFFQPQIPDADKPVSLTSARRLLLQDPRKALPWIKLTSTPPPPPPEDTDHPAGDKDKDEDEHEETEAESGGTPQGTDNKTEWFVRYDLLSSGSDDYDFVAEIDNDGFAHLRFGDGELGRKPEAGTIFHASYRTRNGPAGNVGAETISRTVFRKTLLSGATLQPRNPFAVHGGTDQEPLSEVKLFAPHAFRTTLKRAITAEDYARLAGRYPGVQRAAATLRWTGSWYEALVVIDPLGSEEADQALIDGVTAYLEGYRRMGHDLLVVPAHYVSLYIEMTICVQPHFLRGHVEAALLDLFSNRILPNGKRGFFHPDNLTFGQGIAVSKLVALAQSVAGVQSVKVTRLERLFEGSNGELDQEFLPLRLQEIARLDRDPSFPEKGRIVFKMEGGR